MHNRQLPSRTIQKSSRLQFLTSLFEILTKPPGNGKTKWLLIDEFPPSLLQNGMLYFENINFEIFGYMLSNIDFDKCFFKNCVFKSQLFVNCDFRKCIFGEVIFNQCYMDNQTFLSLPIEIAYEYNKDNKVIHEVISSAIQFKICQQWFQTQISGAAFFLAEIAAISTSSITKKFKIKKNQHLLNQTKSFNADYDTILLNSIDGFYYFQSYNYEGEHYRGWKLHLSVEAQSVKQAFNCVSPILLENLDVLNFKVIDTAIDAVARGERLSRGGQITIYLHQNGMIPLISQSRLRELLQAMSDKLTREKIKVGAIPESDKLTQYSYFSLRNDGHYLDYYSGQSCGSNYNPYNLPCVFEYLLVDKPQSFNIMDHFYSLNITDSENIAKAYFATLMSIVHQYIKPEFVFDIYNLIERYTKSGVYQFYKYRENLLQYVKIKIDNSELDIVILLLEMYFIRNKNIDSNILEYITDYIKELRIKFKNISFDLESLLDNSASEPLFENINYENKSYLFTSFVNLTLIVSSLLGIKDQTIKYKISSKPTASQYLLFSEKIKLLDCQLYLENVSPPIKSFIFKYNSNFVELLKDNKISYDQLLMLPDIKHGLLIKYSRFVNKLLPKKITMNDIIIMPAIILYQLLIQYNAVMRLCKHLGFSLRHLLRFDAKTLILILINVEHTLSLLKLFNIKLDILLTLPPMKLLVLLRYDYFDACPNLTFDSLVKFDNQFIIGLIEKNIFIDNDWSMKMILQLALLPVNKQQIFFNADYSISSIKNKLNISFDQLIKLPVNAIKFIFSKHSIIEKFMSHFKKDMNAILNIENDSKYSVLLCAAGLLSLSNKYGFTYDEIIKSLDVINDYKRLNLSHLNSFKKEFRVLLDRGIPFSEIFKLEYHHLFNLKMDEIYIYKLIQEHFSDFYKDKKSENVVRFKK